MVGTAQSFEYCGSTGLVDGVVQIPSPNCDARPDDTIVDVLVIHAISLPPQYYGDHYVEDLFCNKLDPNIHPYFAEIADSKVSAHFFIKRTGEVLQFVAILNRAWHAGESLFCGRECVNDFSIGVELEGCDEDQFETAQYDALGKLANCLMRAYPAISRENIVGHSDISPGRKTDPGPGFDWNNFRSRLL